MASRFKQANAKKHAGARPLQTDPRTMIGHLAVMCDLTIIPQARRDLSLNAN